MKVDMVIKDVSCGECGNIKSVVVSEGYTRCDWCGCRVSDTNGNTLRTSVFWKGRNDEDAIDLDHCSWACVFSHIRILKNVDFIGMPIPSHSRTRQSSLKSLCDMIDSKKLVKRGSRKPKK